MTYGKAYTYKSEYLANLRVIAEDAFKDHSITHAEPGRWRLHAVDTLGRRKVNYATEIVYLMGGMMFVGGDIDNYIFAYYSDDADGLGRARWMTTDSIGYVMEKARIGQSNNVTTFDVEYARAQIADEMALMADQAKEEAEEDDPDTTFLKGEQEAGVDISHGWVPISTSYTYIPPSYEAAFVYLKAIRQDRALQKLQQNAAYAVLAESSIHDQHDAALFQHEYADITGDYELFQDLGQLPASGLLFAQAALKKLIALSESPAT